MLLVNEPTLLAFPSICPSKMEYLRSTVPVATDNEVALPFPAIVIWFNVASPSTVRGTDAASTPEI
ncbi:MAG: Uncharacterised protein [Chloroflexota bacterium]|nr:MAG: Uncharacterised protein [Chloroflexota bacterium]